MYAVVLWQDWYSDITLYKSGILLNPRNVKMYNNYGLELKSSGRVREAEQQYMVSVKNPVRSRGHLVVNHGSEKEYV